MALRLQKLKEKFSLFSVHKNVDGEEDSLTPVELWSVEDVVVWLKQNGMKCYVKSFRFNLIDGDVLLNLTKKDFAQLRVSESHLSFFKNFIEYTKGSQMSSHDFSISSSGRTTSVNSITPTPEQSPSISSLPFRISFEKTVLHQEHNNRLTIKLVYLDDIRLFYIFPKETSKQILQRIKHEFGEAVSVFYQHENGIHPFKSEHDLQWLYDKSQSSTKIPRLLILSQDESKDLVVLKSQSS
jgi:hypothetical protein